jgi:hypothetical protein
VPGHGRIEHVLAMALECSQRAGLVGSHQARVTDDIGHEDRCQSAVGLHIVGHCRFVVDNAR